MKKKTWKLKTETKRTYDSKRN